MLWYATVIREILFMYGDIMEELRYGRWLLNVFNLEHFSPQLICFLHDINGYVGNKYYDAIL